MTVDLEQFFAQPTSATQRQYEAVRAIIVDKLSAVSRQRLNFTTQPIPYIL